MASSGSMVFPVPGAISVPDEPNVDCLLVCLVSRELKLWGNTRMLPETLMKAHWKKQRWGLYRQTRFSLARGLQF
jgi:hypothetical protein